MTHLILLQLTVDPELPPPLLPPLALLTVLLPLAQPRRAWRGRGHGGVLSLELPGGSLPLPGLLLLLLSLPLSLCARGADRGSSRGDGRRTGCLWNRGYALWGRPSGMWLLTSLGLLCVELRSSLSRDRQQARSTRWPVNNVEKLGGVDYLRRMG